MPCFELKKKKTFSGFFPSVFLLKTSPVYGIISLVSVHLCACPQRFIKELRHILKSKLNINSGPFVKPCGKTFLGVIPAEFWGTVRTGLVLLLIK